MDARRPGYLVRRHNVASASRRGVDGQSLTVPEVAVRAEHGQLAARIRSIGVGRPLADAEPLVRVVDVARFVVDRDGLDFPGLVRWLPPAAERSETANERPGFGRSIDVMVWRDRPSRLNT
jgi:hypothetical protein